MSNNEMWVDKYAPTNLDDMVLSEPIKDRFKQMIKSGDLTNMTIAGIQGIGKTTIAKLLMDELNCVQLVVDCATDNTIDIMRSRVEIFCESQSIDDRLKIVLLDEADSLSGGDRESSAQKALRTIINNAQDDTRFILTANFPSKIMAPIQSRCPPINLKYTGKDVLGRIRYILDTEAIKYDKAALKGFVENVVKPNYPDIRRIITSLQNCCGGGVLAVKDLQESTSDIEKLADELITMINSKKKPNDIRKYILQNRGVFNDDFGKIGSVMFNKLVETTDVKTLRNLTHYLYKINVVSDQEIQFFGFILELIK